MEFRATWPILDDTMSMDELIAEAEADLPNVRPRGLRLFHRRWSIGDGHLCLTADAQDSNKWGRKLPAEPLLTYVKTLQHKLDKTDERVIERAKATGVVTIYSADRFAIKALGVHPACIWGDEWFDSDEAC